MRTSVLYVGLDVHKMSMDVAIAARGGEVRHYGKIGGNREALEKGVRKLQASGAALRFAYEAGPCGYQVYRHLTAQGWPCLVAAPSLIPRRPGDRFSGKTTWGRGHWRWLLGLSLGHPAQQIVLQEYLDAVQEAAARVQRLTAQIRELVPQWRQAPFVRAYQALRGVSLIVAATVAAEIGDLGRFANPKELMAYLGLVPSEHSSGATVRRGRIPKTGNGHARRVLVEAAWAYRLRARITRPLAKRQEGLSKSVREIAWKAQLRLCARYRRLFARGNTKPTIVTALARELAAFLWAIDQAVQPGEA